MIWNVQQTITIGQLRIDGITNSSVLQIGSAGSIQSLSQLYNTGGFKEPAPELTELGAASQALSLVPLPNPT
ncbi:spore germination protein GerPB [Cohnella suwonensis]|uniref:Spore germination protein GerPB n=1 Tax=Cohnella suwonensis TaxID=696072 RepID=A0ABW0LTN0_9BACL